MVCHAPVRDWLRSRSRTVNSPTVAPAARIGQVIPGTRNAHESTPIVKEPQRYAKREGIASRPSESGGCGGNLRVSFKFSPNLAACKNLSGYEIERRTLTPFFALMRLKYCLTLERVPGCRLPSARGRINEIGRAGATDGSEYGHAAALRADGASCQAAAHERRLPRLRTTGARSGAGGAPRAEHRLLASRAG